MRSTYYETLGVNEDAEFSEIKIAYKKLCMEWHPDKHPGNAKVEERFKRIVAAYEVLSDSDKRSFYNASLSQDNTGINFDPSILDPDQFIRTFSELFGDYLDERIPGGFRERINRAAKNRDKDRRKSEGKKGKVSCHVCNDTKRVALEQGHLVIYVSCKACA